ncbi:MAG: serine dehydratase, partial [Clostridia bacterium]|nr:serine dehydratase [Clostridia bacterium]
MQTLKELYKIGKGPSSSHTMGPERSVKMFISKYPDCDFYKAILYGSLAKTGAGHGTDRVIKDTFKPYKSEVIFNYTETELFHEN